MPVSNFVCKILWLIYADISNDKYNRKYDIMLLWTVKPSVN